MATIVPISHSIRWRSRSRNSSMDSVDNQHQQQQQQQQVAPVSPYAGLVHLTSDAGGWEEEPSDDEDASFDELQTSAWLVVPREYANVAQRSRRSSWSEAAAPVSPLSYTNSAAKSMERRRADGSSS